MRSRLAPRAKPQGARGWTGFDKLGTTGAVERVEADVCVVGAGPAGLVVAHRLLQARVSCVVLERLSSQALCQRARAGMLEDRSVRALEAVGLARPILERGATNGVVELRVHGERRVLDYAALTGGRGHFVYPQHLLVRAWADEYLARGGALRFSSDVVAIERDEAGEGASVRFRAASGEPAAVRCRALVLAGGAGCNLLPPGITTHEHTHAFRWLTTMVEMAPLAERTVYAAHPRGFAAHLRRSPELTRYYLQIPAAERLEDWADESITAELELRLGLGAGSPLRGRRVVERDVLDLRVRVREPLQSGCVFLAGDAAHLITPAGGKGMNLAIQDGLELAAGLIARFADGDGQRLASYSDTRLPLIWRTQEFSNWLLTVFSGGALSLHRGTPDPNASFARGIHRAQVERLFAEASFARWFAFRYAGVDEPAV